MRFSGLRVVQRAAVSISFALHLIWDLAGALSVLSPQRSLIRSVQEDVLFSVSVSCEPACADAPTVRWSFMSAAVSRGIGAWRPGAFTNITDDYAGRVQVHDNGSLGLSDLRLQDAGFYVVTVSEGGGASKDTGFVLKVNEVLYEDLQYLSVAALALAVAAALLMLLMWLLDRAWRRLVAWRRRRHDDMTEENATELQPSRRTLTSDL